MLEVKPNKEIMKIKTSIMGASPWQLGWLIAGIVAGSVVYYTLPFPSVIKAPFIVPVVLFFVSIGFVEIDGMNIFGLLNAVRVTIKQMRHPLVLRSRREELDVTEYDHKK